MKSQSEEISWTQSIQEWASEPTPDHARLLIRTYQESEWRSTRLEVLRHFGRFQDSRSLQFLIEIATKNEDLAEQQLAILALSQRRTRTAQLFLRNFYLSGPETLKPHLAYALGQSQDFGSVSFLARDWDQAYARQDWLWLRNIVLALGELKSFEVLPKLHKLMEGSFGKESELLLSMLFALGRLERDPATLQKYETRYVEDSLLYQVYQSALAQVQIRSQLKLEDYLDKTFNSPDPHPILPLELKSFDPRDVAEGLGLFSIEKEWHRFLFALRGVASLQRVDILKKIIPQLQSAADQISFLQSVSGLIDEENKTTALKSLESFSKSENAEIRLEWLSAVSPWMDPSTEGASFFKQGDEAIAIRMINLWSEWILVHLNHKGASHAASKSAWVKTAQNWVETQSLKPVVYGRLVRACTELGLEVNAIFDRMTTDLKNPELRPSLLMYGERFPNKAPLKEILGASANWTKEEKENSGVRLLGLIETGLETVKEKTVPNLKELLGFYSEHFNVDFRMGVLRVLRGSPLAEWEKFAIEQTQHQNQNVQLNAVIALKGYSESRTASEALAEMLRSSSDVIQGRALDALCFHSSLLAKRAVIEYLRENIVFEEVVDKVYRSFDPKNKGGAEFVEIIEQLLKANPDHPQWEKLVSLRDRLAVATRASNANAPSTASPAQVSALKEVDEKLKQVIPQFDRLDPTIQSALRAAEQPFTQSQDLQNLPIDKAPTVLEYCKALDLILERHLGQKHLFNKLDTQLHDFQTLWHRVGFGEDYPSADKVMGFLGLKGKITPENFPLHKAKMMCGTFFNGKILQDRFKVFDGLRAWAVIFLIFTRKIPLTTGAVGPLLKLGSGDEKAMEKLNDQCVSIAKRLMLLQDLRNPAAHRQTYTDLSSVIHVRNEAIELVNTVLTLVL